MKKFILLILTFCSIYSTILSQCTSYFTYSNIGYTYFFADSSSGEDSTTIFSWNFGNGDTSNQQYPTETFLNSGTYVVCLTINTVDSTCTNQHCDTITIATLPCQVSFTYTNNGYSYQFTGNATGVDSTTTYFWDFGNSDQSNLQNPNETFGAPGIYEVCFSMTTASDSCTNWACRSITVNSLNCQVSFTYAPGGNNYQFTDYSIGVDSSTIYSWNFGDGDTSSLPNPTDSFPGPGTYLVCLNINTIDSGCVNQACQYITIQGCTALINFNISTTDSLNYRFTDASTGLESTATFSWAIYDTSNHQIITAVDTVFNYNGFPYPGTYKVCDSVVNDTCHQVVCQYINVPVINGITDKNRNEHNIRMFPNPATTGQFFVDMGSLSAAEIGVFNTVGENVSQPIRNKSGMIKIDVSSLAEGVYVIRIITGADLYTAKLIINKIN